MNSGEYASYAAWSKRVPLTTMRVTLYSAPVLSKECEDEMGRYLAYQVLV